MYGAGTLYIIRHCVYQPRSFEFDPRGILHTEGGLVKKGEFREGTHTAHGNHRSKTICRTNIGVCAFDPHGPCGSNAQTPIFVRQIVFDLWLPCAVWVPSLNSPFLTRSPSIGPGMFLALFFDINRKHNPPHHARGHRGGPGYRPNIGKCSLFPSLTTQIGPKAPVRGPRGLVPHPLYGPGIFLVFFHPNREHKPLRSAQGREGRALWPPHFRPKRARWAARAPPVARLFTASSRF